MMKKVLIGLIILGSFSAFSSLDDKKGEKQVMSESELIKKASSNLIRAGKDYLKSREGLYNVINNTFYYVLSTSDYNYCETGRRELGKSISFGVPFGIGRKKACLKSRELIMSEMKKILPRIKTYLSSFKNFLEVTNSSELVLKEVNDGLHFYQYDEASLKLKTLLSVIEFKDMCRSQSRLPKSISSLSKKELNDPVFMEDFRGKAKPLTKEYCVLDLVEDNSSMDYIFEYMPREAILIGNLLINYSLNNFGYIYGDLDKKINNYSNWQVGTLQLPYLKKAFSTL